MSDYPGGAWLTRYRERVNGDAELKVIGDWFTTTFGLTFGDTRYAVKVEKGSIVDIVTPKLDTRTPFGFRAPVSVWRKFLSAILTLEPDAAQRFAQQHGIDAVTLHTDPRLLAEIQKAVDDANPG